MLTPSLNTVMTRLLIVAAVLATVIIFVIPAAFAQEAVRGMMDDVEYDENGTDAVITFTSTDPEGSGIDWDVTGLDADLFMIDERGVLMFKKSPNYEGAKDKARSLNADSDFFDYYDSADSSADATTGLVDRGDATAAIPARVPARDREFEGGDNKYQITVRATEQRTEGADLRALSTETDVTVTVMDMPEDGSAMLNLLQPEVGTPITASVSDPDGTTGTDPDAPTDITWQWYVSKVTNPVLDEDDHWIMATGADASATAATSAYEPKGKRVAGEGRTLPDPNVAVDEGKYLRAVATYLDRTGATSTARVRSMNPVRAEVTSDSDRADNPENGSPGFSSTGDYTRTVPEDTAVGMPVGDPVTAIDPNGDTLTYEHLDIDTDGTTDGCQGGTCGDAAYFSIDMASGQLTVKMKLDYDANMDGYKFYVRATDPSGETDEQEVTVKTTDTNDAPKIMGSLDEGETGNAPPAASELRVMEQNGDTYTGGPDMLLLGLEESGLGAKNVFTAPDGDARGQIFWSLTGVDADVFALSQSSDIPNPTGPTGLNGPDEPIALRFKAPPDYETPIDSNKDSVYKVTLVATDSRGATDMRPVTVFVTQVPEQGKLTLSEAQPLTGNAITAEVDDPDNGVAIVTWQWLKATSTANAFTVIPGATTDTYTPITADNGFYLQAKATYTDITSNPDDRETTGRDERTQKEGASVTETLARTADPEDGSGTSDKLYRVMVTSDNAVRVGPTDPTEVGAPQFAMSRYDRMVVENAEVGTIVGDPVRVEPEKDVTFKYDLEATITGADDFFEIDNHGQIRVKEVEFWDPIPAMLEPNCDEDGTDAALVDCPGMDDPVLDYEGTNTFTLIVTAEAMNDSSRTAVTEVTVSLENLNERPYFDRTSRNMVSTTTGAATTQKTIEYMEQRTNRVVPLAAVEPDGGSLRWEVTGTDADAFMITDVDDINDGKDRRELHFKSQPDYENGMGSATSTGGRAGDTYMVTVRATEMAVIGGGTSVALAAELDIMVQVTNAKEAGMVDFTLLQPEVGTEITASVSDPDMDVATTGTGAGWQWYRAKVNEPSRSPNPTSLGGEWELITGATAAAYTPAGVNSELTPPTTTRMDEDKYLLARVAYSDGSSTSTDDLRYAVGITAYPVRENVTNVANNSPDFNVSKTTREVPEDTAVGMPVGDPVDVDRNEDGDVLTYEIVMVAESAGTAATALIPGNPGNDSVVMQDLQFFSIDKADGQLRVKKMLSAEMTDGRNYDPDATDAATTGTAKAGEYTVVVRATDPSGEPGDENRDDIVVTITATDVNEAPMVMGMAELSVNEVDSSRKDYYVGLGSVASTTADSTLVPGVVVENATTTNLYHRSEQDIVDRAIWPEPIGGVDGALFEYSTPDTGIGRRLHFKSPPDYENPMDEDGDNVYKVTITVTDEDGAMGEKPVRVTVMNVDEMGELTLSPDQPDDGMPVKAELTDPDGVVVITDWKWHATSSRDRDDAMMVAGASMSEYTGKVGDFLWAEVMYRDGASMENDYVTVLDERNNDPDTSPTTTENKKFATDTDGNGMISEAEITADTDEHNSDNMLDKGTVNAVQTDPDPPTDPDAPATGVEMFERMVYENVPSTGYVGDPFDAEKLGDRNVIGGPDGANFVFAEDNDQVGSTYYDSVLATTTDAKDKVGQLALKPVTHLDYEKKDTYIVEISDPDAERELSVYRVTILVMDVNEHPTAPEELKGPPPLLNTEPMFLDANGEVSTTTTRMVAENSATGTAVGMPVEATDTDRGDTVAYTLGGTDAASFTIGSDTGQIMTSADLDYETKMTYMVTVTATDDEGETAMIDVTINVTNVGLDNAYDMDDSGAIERAEVIEAINDFLFGDGSVTRDDVIVVINLYLFS